MGPFCNDMLEYLQNYKCCMNGILEVPTEKDMVKAKGFEFIKITQSCKPLSYFKRFKT